MSESCPVCRRPLPAAGAACPHCRPPGEPAVARALEKPRRGRKAPAVGCLLAAIGLYGAYYLASSRMYVIPSSAMEPTLRGPAAPTEAAGMAHAATGDRIRVDGMAGLLGNPRQGEIWTFRAPAQASPEEKTFIKRVIGVPGDTIEIVPGSLKRNGGKLAEPYVREPADYTVAPVHLGPNEYFVLGDNRNNSNDSHVYGPVKRERFLGRATLRYWPPDRFGLL